MKTTDTKDFELNGAVMRPARTSDELKALMRLCYDAYEKTELRKFMHLNRHRMNLDQHDARAVHLGLFASETTDALPLACIRIVTEKHTEQSRLVGKIGEEYPDLRDRVTGAPEQPFPCFNYFPDLIARLTEVSRRLCNGHSMVEPGRFAVTPKLQGGKLGIFMIQAVAAFCMARGWPVAMVACSDSHVRMYNAMGFRAVDGVGRRLYDGFQCNYLVGDVRELPRSVLPVLLAMADAWDRSGSVRYKPEQALDRRRRVALAAKRPVRRLIAGLGYA